VFFRKRQGKRLGGRGVWGGFSSHGIRENRALGGKVVITEVGGAGKGGLKGRGKGTVLGIPSGGSFL